MGGVFVVLASGCAVALIIGILEFLWNVRKVAVDERVSYLICTSSHRQCIFLSLAITQSVS